MKITEKDKDKDEDKDTETYKSNAKHQCVPSSFIHHNTSTMIMFLITIENWHIYI